MSVVAAAVIGSTVVGGYQANRAGKQAAQGQAQGMEQSLEITNRARDDVMKLFDKSSKSARIGMDQAMNFYKQAATQRMTPFLQGNVAAQDVIGQGAQQAQNAILGLPVDMGFVQPQQVEADTSYLLGAQLPEGQTTMAEDRAQAESTVNNMAGGIMGAVKSGAGSVVPQTKAQMYQEKQQALPNYMRFR